jgi:hypothetical protein
MVEKTQIAPLSILIDDWCREAMRESGSDWNKISAHINQELAALTPEAKARLVAEAKLTLTESGIETHGKAH